MIDICHFKNNRLFKDQREKYRKKYRKKIDSADHQFFVNVLETFGFEKNLVRWIKILLKNQESCITNGGITTNYFGLEKGIRQGDPVPAYIFMLLLK